MQLPPDLREALERRAAGIPGTALARAAQDLSRGYRHAAHHPVTRLDDDVGRAAYLVTRFPATFAAAQAVIRQVAAVVDVTGWHDLLDLGAGAGPVLWALGPSLPALERARLVDRDADLLALARALWHEAPARPGMVLDVEVGDLGAARTWPEADVVVLCYALGELPGAVRPRLVDTAWAASRRALILIEPGSREGCARVLAARDHLVAIGGHIAAPCPHDRACPMAPPDWCHFGVRLPRTRLHRQAKGATLGHEDEKFSYVVAVKAPVVARPARVVSRPLVRTGHVLLDLCTVQGLTRRTVSRRDPALHRLARHAAWGDGIDLAPR